MLHSKHGFERLREPFTARAEEKYRLQRFKERVKKHPGERDVASRAYHKEKEGAADYPMVEPKRPKEEDEDESMYGRIKKRLQIERRGGLKRGGK